MEGIFGFMYSKGEAKNGNMKKAAEGRVLQALYSLRRSISIGSVAVPILVRDTSETPVGPGGQLSDPSPSSHFFRTSFALLPPSWQCVRTFTMRCEIQ